MIVLDTDHMTLLEWASGPEAHRLQARVAVVPAEERATTIVSYEEQSRGWLAFVAKARTVVQQVDAYGRLHRHLRAYQRINVLDFNDRAADEFQRLTRGRLRTGTLDLKIAAIALAHDATLLSRNLRDFHKIEGLKVEDWTV
jgi:tRNA(fMet)-specific endonuclease VapC